MFTLQHGGDLGILNAAHASLDSANLITFKYERGQKSNNSSDITGKEIRTIWQGYLLQIVFATTLV